MERNHNLTVNELSAKFKSKSELYNVLTREGNIYLPPKKDSTQKFLRSIMLGTKLYVKCDEVAVIKVPQYKELFVKDLLKFASTKINIKRYIPDYEYSKEPNREWLCNLLNTLIPEDFKSFIAEKTEIRKQNLIESQNLSINAKPEFIDIFKKSQAVSLMKGRSHFLTRMPRITKDKQMIQDLEEEKERYDSKVSNLIEEIETLRNRIQQLEDSQVDNDDNIEKLSNLYELGVIDENGNLIKEQMD